AVSQFERGRSMASLNQQQSITQGHDDTRDGLSRRTRCTIAEYTPRKELQHEPPPPMTHGKYKPAGPRRIAASLRRMADGSEAVCVHRSACRVYPTVPPPWLIDLREDQIRIVPDDSSGAEDASSPGDEEEVPLADNAYKGPHVS